MTFVCPRIVVEPWLLLVAVRLTFRLLAMRIGHDYSGQICVGADPMERDLL